jgi:DNA mismatch endonuclease (patch repair protein)
MARRVLNTTPERSRLMSKIRGKDTKPELVFRKALWATGVRYRLNVRKLPGSPDVVLNRFKIAIFIDGDFWHGHKWEERKVRLKSNRDFWIDKIEKNMERDIRNNSDLYDLGFRVFRFWEHEVKHKLQDCIDLVLSAINEYKK